jgi:DNA-binding NarL/FixJ family response regulator
MPKRILIIDDHAAVRAGLREILLDGLGELDFGQACDAAEAVEEIRASRWNVAVLDLNLPGRGGLELIRSLKDEQPDLGILVYTAHPEEQFGLRAIRAGADGYVTKDRPPEEVPLGVAAILKGGRYVSPGLTSILVENARDANRAGQALSDRELQVLRMIAGGKGPTEIGADLNLSSKTVTTYRSRVLQKLKLRTNADLVRYAVEHRIVE